MTEATATRDHVIPRAWGRTVHNNTLAAHKRCNEIRKAATPTGCQLVWLCVVSAKRVAQIAREQGERAGRELQVIEDARFAALMAAMRPRVMIERRQPKKIIAKRPARPGHDGRGSPVWPSSSSAGNVTPGVGSTESV